MYIFRGLRNGIWIQALGLGLLDVGMFLIMFEWLRCYALVYQTLDSGNCTIGGQNEDSGKFHVRMRAARHR